MKPTDSFYGNISGTSQMSQSEQRTTEDFLFSLLSEIQERFYSFDHLCAEWKECEALARVSFLLIIFTPCMCVTQNMMIHVL